MLIFGDSSTLLLLSKKTRKNSILRILITLTHLVVIITQRYSIACKSLVLIIILLSFLRKVLYKNRYLYYLGLRCRQLYLQFSLISLSLLVLLFLKAIILKIVLTYYLILILYIYLILRGKRLLLGVKLLCLKIIRSLSLYVYLIFFIANIFFLGSLSLSIRLVLI